MVRYFMSELYALFCKFFASAFFYFFKKNVKLTHICKNGPIRQKLGVINLLEAAKI